eukprot:TRINITY_DN551_c0_g1_i3.p1 TRINITY_DN551_c0_g1~~TRINITY_DN551_c0_g1_i3.p1  ORF type:complete len:387 (-),score=188.74 TRINITY_DN551_c0_g1_i3:933-2003(-)
MIASRVEVELEKKTNDNLVGGIGISEPASRLPSPKKQPRSERFSRNSQKNFQGSQRRSVGMLLLAASLSSPPKAEQPPSSASEKMWMPSLNIPENTDDTQLPSSTSMFPISPASEIPEDSEADCRFEEAASMLKAETQELILKRSLNNDDSEEEEVVVEKTSNEKINHNQDDKMVVEDLFHEEKAQVQESTYDQQLDEKIETDINTMIEEEEHETTNIENMKNHDNEDDDLNNKEQQQQQQQTAVDEKTHEIEEQIKDIIDATEIVNLQAENEELKTEMVVSRLQDLLGRLSQGIESGRIITSSKSESKNIQNIDEKEEEVISSDGMMDAVEIEFIKADISDSIKGATLRNDWEEL